MKNACLVLGVLAGCLCAFDVRLTRRQRTHDHIAQSAHVAARNLGNWTHAIEYVGSIQVGTPPHGFTVLFDTGSGNLLLPAARCDDKACIAHKQYDSAASSSGREIAWLDDVEPGGQILRDTANVSNHAASFTDRDTQKIAFNSGTAYAQFVQDTVCLGSTSADALCVHDARFLAAVEESDEAFLTGNWDGVFGLGMNVSVARTFAVATALLDANGLPLLFSFYLGPNMHDGELTFGSYKKERFSGTMNWVSVSHPRYWQITLADLSVGGVPLQVGCNCKGCCQAVVDSGSSLIMAPAFVHRLLTDKLNITENCTDRTTFPAVGFLMKDQSGSTVHLELQPEDYMDRQEDKGEVYCWPHFMAIGSTSFGPALVLGMPFLRAFYTVFDYEHKRLGFARSVPVRPSPLQHPSQQGVGRHLRGQVPLQACRGNCSR